MPGHVKRSESVLPLLLLLFFPVSYQQPRAVLAASLTLSRSCSVASVPAYPTWDFPVPTCVPAGRTAMDAMNLYPYSPWKRWLRSLNIWLSCMHRTGACQAPIKCRDMLKGAKAYCRFCSFCFFLFPISSRGLSLQPASPYPGPAPWPAYSLRPVSVLSFQNQK